MIYHQQANKLCWNEQIHLQPPLMHSLTVSASKLCLMYLVVTSYKLAFYDVIKLDTHPPTKTPCNFLDCDRPVTMGSLVSTM